ncbi:hypothetical protein [uncultured Paludibaculum sp.]|uniref:hypothetical protein n=1 Tax=uncultured Paludibaculum sp. TaxID=1765020 RepID=UPI002AAA7486|nr:hypothetical protein [uncultured Paludibaculum sp.]
MLPLRTFVLALAAWTLSLSAQPRLGQIEIYGTRKIPHEKILKAIGMAPGDPLTKPKGDIEDTLESIDGVVRAQVEAFCCEQGNPILYVGILERGTLNTVYRAYPDQDLALPDEIVRAYADFTAALSRASAEGDLKEDLSQGYSLMQNLPCHVAQERFIGLAQIHVAVLRNVLKNGRSSDLRAIAAYILGYAPDKSAVIGDIQLAMQDPDGGVRANAARTLRGFAFYSLQNPDSDLKVQATWFVELANSIDLGDRLEAAKGLLLFTEKPNEAVTANIRDRALPSLLEVARWQYLPHALPAFLVVGRVAGMPDEELEKAWASGDREKILKSIEKPAKKPSSK